MTKIEQRAFQRLDRRRTEDERRELARAGVKRRAALEPAMRRGKSYSEAESERRGIERYLERR